MKNMHRLIYKLLKDKKGGCVLDVACGKGGLSAALQQTGLKVFSVDRYDTPQDKDYFLIADLNASLPYKKETFDFIVCAESLQYLENHEKLFSEFNRAAKKGGTLIVSFPNILTVSSRLYFLRRGYFPHFKPLRTKEEHKEWDHFIYNPISFVEVFQLLKKNGFELKNVLASDFKLKGWWLYPFIKTFYLLGLIFDRNRQKNELIKQMASKELLMGSHVVVCSVKANN